MRATELVRLFEEVRNGRLEGSMGEGFAEDTLVSGSAGGGPARGDEVAFVVLFAFIALSLLLLSRSIALVSAILDMIFFGAGRPFPFGAPFWPLC